MVDLGLVNFIEFIGSDGLVLATGGDYGVIPLLDSIGLCLTSEFHIV